MQDVVVTALSFYMLPAFKDVFSESKSVAMWT